MWTWIFAIAFVLAVLVARTFARWTNFWQRRCAYWQAAYLESEKKRHDMHIDPSDDIS